MTNITVTDADREALEALRPFLKSLGITELMLILEALARARAEGAAELDALKTRLALAEAVCESCTYLENEVWFDYDKHDAWRAAK